MRAGRIGLGYFDNRNWLMCNMKAKLCVNFLTFSTENDEENYKKFLCSNNKNTKHIFQTHI